MDHESREMFEKIIGSLEKIDSRFEEMDRKFEKIDYRFDARSEERRVGKECRL